MKKYITIILIIALLFLLLFCINLIPTKNLETNNMHLIEGKWINVYYENEEAAAMDVLTYADHTAQFLAQLLGVDTKPNINVYIYDQQKTMQSKKYGYVAFLLNFDEYITDHIGTQVLLTSPANPGAKYDYTETKLSVHSELCYAFLNTINEDLSPWIAAGLVDKLCNRPPMYEDFFANTKIPSFTETEKKNPISSENTQWNSYARLYIEYLVQTYGIETLQSLIETEDYEECFGKSQKEIYDEWVLYIQNYPQFPK